MFNVKMKSMLHIYIIPAQQEIHSTPVDNKVDVSTVSVRKVSPKRSRMRRSRTFGPMSPKALTASVSRAMAKIDRAVLSNWRL